jgi:hypothetical protein
MLRNFTPRNLNGISLQPPKKNSLKCIFKREKSKRRERPSEKNLLWAKNYKLHMLEKICGKIRGEGERRKSYKKI